MKNNKGFTLVELLAVIVILSSIALVTVASVSSSLGRRDEKECNEQIALAKNAAKIYFSLKGGTEVSVETLKAEGYFASNQKVDRLPEEAMVTYSSNQYTFNGNCTD